LSGGAHECRAELEYWPGFKESPVKNVGGDNEIISKISENIIHPRTSTPILEDNTEYVNVDTETKLLRDQGEIENGEQVETETEILKDQGEMKSAETGEQMEET
jgi:hypothetical protein